MSLVFFLSLLFVVLAVMEVAVLRACLTSSVPATCMSVEVFAPERAVSECVEPFVAFNLPVMERKPEAVIEPAEIRDDSLKEAACEHLRTARLFLEFHRVHLRLMRQDELAAERGTAEINETQARLRSALSELEGGDTLQCILDTNRVIYDLTLKSMALNLRQRNGRTDELASRMLAELHNRKRHPWDFSRPECSSNARLVSVMGSVSGKLSCVRAWLDSPDHANSIVSFAQLAQVMRLLGEAECLMGIKLV
jgi:hypothetical protein